MSKRKSDASEKEHFASRPSQIRKMAQPTATTTIELTPKEEKLKSLLLEVARHVDETQEGRDPVVLRWAGGWVRDKLLGIQSHDIDTAINVMTGAHFSAEIVALCKIPEMVEKHNVTETDIGNLHKIAANPEKSKHLETTTIKLFDFDVDFVNLRKETYTDDSRNPQVEFGTAEEDALRRDATVNALFYNLNTGKVEDFTGGLADMDNKLIKTPLDPFQTFMDDPLRVLRLVRFASRLQFTIDPDAEKVMGDSKVMQALRLKISRERVGVEVEKMLKGDYPSDALERINTLGLYHTVFTDPGKADAPQPDISNWRTVYECLDRLREARTPGSIYDVLVHTKEAAYFSWVLAAVVPWAPFVQISQKPGKQPPPYATLAAREGIKAPNKVCDVITAAERHRADIMALKNAVCAKEPYINERDRFGMAIRQWEARGGQWRLQVLSAFLVEAWQVLDATTKDTDKERDFLKGWQLFLDHLQELDVMEAPLLKRLIDGRELAKALSVRPGPWMTRALDVCVAWQLRNPGATDPAGAVEEVRGKAEELGIPIK
ncbi:CCA tRNA nucleotidyltransferase- mitochondrial [Apiospora rasikravindrae]|uniref:CCA tRNA nucleotidyltransferase- mitochondrial n=1 Tax=Apiospora rasikravindrae TaxID=990691 RepID=A0ABR1U0X0_9PEZI